MSGTSVSGASIVLNVYTDSGKGTKLSGPYPVTASGTNWTVSSISPVLAGGNYIDVTAQLDPNGVSADANATVTATSATLNVPSAFGWSVTFQVGPNTGSATDGSVVSVGDTWTLTVADANQSTGTGYMMKGSTQLANPIQVDKAAISGDTPGDTIANYNTELSGITGYGQATGTYVLPLHVRQKVVSTDIGGTYSITLNYTITPTY